MIVDLSFPRDGSVNDGISQDLASISYAMLLSKFLCPVAAMLGYLAIRPDTVGPLFVFAKDSTLSRPRALTTVGVDVSRYNGHSFRIGRPRRRQGQA